MTALAVAILDELLALALFTAAIAALFIALLGGYAP